MNELERPNPGAPYRPISPEPPNRSGNWSKGCIIAAVAAFVGAVTCVVLLIGGGMWIASWGIDVVAQQVANDIENNPVIVQHIGLINSIEVDWTASMAEPGEDVFVFELSGSKGRGVLVAESKTIDVDTENVTWGRLKLPSGEQYDLFEDQGEKPQ